MTFVKKKVFSASMSNENNKSDSANKRKLDESIDEIVKKAKDEEYEIGDILDRVDKALLEKEEMDFKIELEEEKVGEEYSTKLEKIDEEIKRMEKKKAEVNIRISVKKSEVRNKIASTYKAPGVVKSIVKDLKLLIRGKKILFYPSNAYVNENCLFGCLYDIILDKPADAFVYEYLGIEEKDRFSFQKFVVKNIDLIRGTGIVEVGGRVEGYKGDETKFEIQHHLGIKVEGYPSALQSKGIDWEAELKDEETQPEMKDIEWPDFKSTWATAKVSICVWILKMKNAQNLLNQ